MTPFEIMRTPLQIKRLSGGAYVNGIWIEGTQSTINATASIQPTTGDEVLLIPEARREAETYKFYTSTRMYAINDQVPNQNPDQVTVLKGPFTGIIFELFAIYDWQNNSLFNLVNHYKYVAMRLAPLS